MTGVYSHLLSSAMQQCLLATVPLAILSLPLAQLVSNLAAAQAAAALLALVRLNRHRLPCFAEAAAVR